MATVLIVDDEPDIVMLLRLALEAAGFTTVEAFDGVEALAVIEEHRPDVVLLDMMMPVMDGWTTLEHLGDREGSPQVIAVTAKAAARDHDRAMSLGAADFVTKPFEPQMLIQRMREVMGRDGAGARPAAGPDEDGTAPR